MTNPRATTLPRLVMPPAPVAPPVPVAGPVLSTVPANCGCPSGNPQPQKLQPMDPVTLHQMAPLQRVQWYKDMLQPYQVQLANSAACNGIPQQLLATVILNELADINAKQDIRPQNFVINIGFQTSMKLASWVRGGPATTMSLGIAQIQTDTAMAHGLIEENCPPGQPQPAPAPIPTNVPEKRQEQIREDARRELVARRLTIPQYAIEAAAREIRILLLQMTYHTANPWQQSFGFTLQDLSSLAQPSDLYNHVSAGSPKDKEIAIAELVVAAYNSPDIVIARHATSFTPATSGNYATIPIYRNARIHGNNSGLIAGELYDYKLFH